MKILGIVGNKQVAGAVEIYRITLPFTYLNNHSGIRCAWMPIDQAAAHLRDFDLETVFDNDIVVLHRTLSDVADVGSGVVEALRVYGARIVYEADDDYSGRYRDVEDDPGLTWKPFIPLADAITVTTKPLAELAREESGGKPVYVVPNAIQYKWFTKVAQEAERAFPDHLTIMVAGTQTHYHDWKVVAEVMPDVLADYPQVKFLVGGYRWDYMEELDLEFLPPVHYSRYPHMLAQADILCAPLIPDDQFNHAKSPIKAIEGWCAARQVGKTRLGGCAVVASDGVVYRGTVQHRHNGLLVEHTPEAWDSALRRLIEDRLLRQKLQIYGLKSARRYSMATCWKNWERVYTEIGG